MEIIFRILMYLIPFAIVGIGYWWLARKLLALKKVLFRVIGFSLWGAGVLYTATELARTFRTALTNEFFNVLVLLINVFVMAFIAIVIGIGEPESQTGTEKEREKND